MQLGAQMGKTVSLAITWVHTY